MYDFTKLLGIFQAFYNHYFLVFNFEKKKLCYIQVNTEYINIIFCIQCLQMLKIISMYNTKYMYFFLFIVIYQKYYL